MSNQITRTVLLVLFVIIVSFQSTSAQITNSDFLFLQISTVASANGMGNAGLTLVNSSSALYNPAALGLFHLDNNIGLSAPKRTAWLTPVVDDLLVSSRSLSVGFNLKQIFPSHNLPVDISFGFGQSKKRIEYGPIIQTDELGNQIGLFYPAEKVDIYSYSIGIKRGLEVGIGYNKINITSHLSGFGAGAEYTDPWIKKNASDFGLIARLPIGEIFSDQLSFNIPIIGRVNPVMTPSIAKVTRKVDQLPPFVDRDPEREIKTTGWSVLFGLNTGSASLFSVNMIDEREESEIVIEKSGLEIGLAGTYFIRSGSFDDPVGRVVFDTEGWGFSLRGPLDLALEANLFGQPKGIIKFVLEHLDLRVDYTKYPDDPGLPLANTEFTTWSISL